MADERKSIYDVLRERDNSPPSVLKEGANLEDLIKTFAPNFYNGAYQDLKVRDVDGVLDWLYGNKLLHPEDPETVPLIEAIQRNLEYDVRDAFRRLRAFSGKSSSEKKTLPSHYTDNKF